MTGCERILARLEQGPATAAELYATTYTVVHSRIADLRKRGYVITCEHIGGVGAASHVYTLCSEEPRVAVVSPSVASAAGTPSPASSEQLSLTEAA